MMSEEMAELLTTIELLKIELDDLKRELERLRAEIIGYRCGMGLR